MINTVKMKLLAGGLLSAMVMTGCTTMTKTDEMQKIKVYAVNSEGVGDSIGTVTFIKADQGLVVKPDLKGLPAGQHGFHIHENPSCEPDMKDGKAGAALKAGSHYDPQNTGKHGYPQGDGHLGDLPAITVNADGTATSAVQAPRLSLDAIQGRALMIHAGGDNYSDQPEALGGGGARIACGVIK